MSQIVSLPVVFKKALVSHATTDYFVITFLETAQHINTAKSSVH